MWLLILLLLFVLLGCEKKTMIAWEPPAQPVRILSPRDADTLQVNWHWPSDSTQCNWEFGTADTRFLARVLTILPGGQYSARVFKYNTDAKMFAAYGDVVSSAADTLDIFYGSAAEYGSARDRSDSATFYVQAVTADSVYVSPTITVHILSFSRVDTATVPIAPKMDSLYLGSNFIGIRWCDRSFNEEGFHIFYMLADNSLWGEVAKGADSTDYTFTFYHPHREYRFWITAWNRYGESAPSDTLNIVSGARPA